MKIWATRRDRTGDLLITSRRTSDSQGCSLLLTRTLSYSCPNGSANLVVFTG
jgi:hypothetical protein